MHDLPPYPLSPGAIRIFSLVSGNHTNPGSRSWLRDGLVPHDAVLSSISDVRKTILLQQRNKGLLLGIFWFSFPHSLACPAVLHHLMPPATLPTPIIRNLLFGSCFISDCIILRMHAPFTLSYHFSSPSFPTHHVIRTVYGIHFCQLVSLSIFSVFLLVCIPILIRISLHAIGLRELHSNRVRKAIVR